MVFFEAEFNHIFSPSYSIEQFLSDCSNSWVLKTSLDIACINVNSTKTNITSVTLQGVSQSMDQISNFIENDIQFDGMLIGTCMFYFQNWVPENNTLPENCAHAPTTAPSIQPSTTPSYSPTSIIFNVCFIVSFVGNEMTFMMI